MTLEFITADSSCSIGPRPLSSTSLHLWNFGSDDGRHIIAKNTRLFVAY